MKSQVQSGDFLSHNVTDLTFSTSLFFLTFTKSIIFSLQTVSFLRSEKMFYSSLFFLPVFFPSVMPKQVFNTHMWIHRSMYSCCTVSIVQIPTDFCHSECSRATFVFISPTYLHISYQC